MSDFTARRIDKLRRRFAPAADHVIIMVNSQTWGGCSSVGAGNAFFTAGSGMTTVAHELGHNLFSLDDEYVSAEATSNFTGVSRFANTSERPADWANLKWSALVTGLFRPVLECRMNQNDPPWCPVCGRKIADDLAVFQP
jgi:hypothetical protein